MAKSLLEQIEGDALDSSVPLVDALRKCIALGGQSGSEELRDWAALELQGYKDLEKTPLPDYREVLAPLQMDGVNFNTHITQQTISSSQLPDFVADKISETLKMRQGVGELEELVRHGRQTGGAVKLGIPGGAEVVRLMNAQMTDPYQSIERIYWAVSPTAINAILDQVRNYLVQLVAEMRAMSPGEDKVRAEVATQAVNVVVKGMGRKTVTVNTAQTSGSDSPAMAKVEPAEEPDSPFWTTSRRIGAAVVGVATIAGAVFAAIQVF